MKHLTVAGFKAAGIAAGLKKRGGKDLGLIYSATPASAAGVFTRNRVQAAPVILARERLQSGRCQAIVVNSGNANCCTGAQGLSAARAMTRAAAAALGLPEEMVLVASTGVIGAPLPVEKVDAAVPGLVEALAPGGFSDFAAAIMTTDTVPKIRTQSAAIDGRRFTIMGVAKGSGMIRPDMATMLAFVCTDVAIQADRLQAALSAATDRSFNRITVDGDTSTNDTVLVMANGASGVQIENVARQAIFQQVLDEVMMGLARMVVKDGEGATKLVEIQVQGARSDADADRVAETVAHSNLVKTALFGEDANWGRILAAAGRAGVPLDPDRIDIFFDHALMVSQGAGCGPQAEAEATRVLQQPEFTIRIDLHLGPGRSSILTCDFSVDYVRINADYRS